MANMSNVFKNIGLGNFIDRNKLKAHEEQHEKKCRCFIKEWQGLTDEEIGLLTTGDEWSHLETPILASFARAIEDKLKEKNS